MARINDRLLVQRVGDRLVVIDDQSGSETPVELTEGPRLTAMVAYLTNPEDPLGVLADALQHLVEVGATTDVGAADE